MPLSSSRCNHSFATHHHLLPMQIEWFVICCEWWLNFWSLGCCIIVLADRNDRFNLNRKRIIKWFTIDLRSATTVLCAWSNETIICDRSIRQNIIRQVIRIVLICEFSFAFLMKMKTTWMIFISTVLSRHNDWLAFVVFDLWRIVVYLLRKHSSPNEHSVEIYIWECRWNVYCSAAADPDGETENNRIDFVFVERNSEEDRMAFNASISWRYSITMHLVLKEQVGLSGGEAHIRWCDVLRPRRFSNKETLLSDHTCVSGWFARASVCVPTRIKLSLWNERGAWN